MSNFFWNNKIIKYNSLDKDIYTDILIIGGGITGISILNELINTKYKITLIDKDRLINGITSYTTGKISYLQGNIYSKLYNNFNLNTAKLYYESQIDAINKILNNIKKYKIDCDIEKVKSIIYTKTNKNKIIKEKEILDKLNIKNKLIYNNLGLEVYDTYVFNPIKYLLGILNKINKFVNIYDHTRAIDIKYKNKLYITKTNKGVITSKYVIIACHYPFFIKPLFIPLKTYVKREYVNVINMKKKYESIINIDDDLCSIRYYNNNLIYGSNKHELYNKINYKDNYIKSINDTYKIFNKKPYITWMNQDIVSNDYISFIGKIKNNLYIATAYNGWGMTNGVLSSIIISEDILKGYSKYDKLFNPNRINLVMIKNSFLKSFNYLKVYIESLFKKNNPYYIKIKGIIYGVYKDKNNVVHKIKLICPHMKCNLVFNEYDETWDCPCHASRFDLDGKLITGPSKKNLKTK